MAHAVPCVLASPLGPMSHANRENKQTNMKLSSSIGFAFTVELRNVREVKMCRRLFYDGAIR